MPIEDPTFERRVSSLLVQSRPGLGLMYHCSSLRIAWEYQDSELAFYTIEWAEDNKHIERVKNPRLIETGYQSPQLKLWTLGPDEWLLFLKLPDYAARKKTAKEAGCDSASARFPYLSRDSKPSETPRRREGLGITLSIWENVREGQFRPEKRSS